jgi:hypothetical protein
MRRLRNFTRGKIALARLLGIGKPCLRGPVNMGGQIRHTLDQRVKILRVERQQFCFSPRRHGAAAKGISNPSHQTRAIAFSSAASAAFALAPSGPPACACRTVVHLAKPEF